MTIVIWILVIILILNAIGNASAFNRIFTWINNEEEKRASKSMWNWESGPDPEWAKNNPNSEYVSEYTLAMLTGDKYFKHYKDFCPKLYQIEGFGVSEIKALEYAKPDAVIIDVLSTNSSEMAFFDLLRGSESLKNVPAFVLVNNKKEKAVFGEKLTSKDTIFMKPCENLFGKIKSALKVRSQ